MISVVNDDIFNAPKNQIICHQVNSRGKMGTGIAKTIKEKYPSIYEEYVNICCTMNPFGKVWIVQEKEDDHYIANMFAQDYYGRDKRYTDYEAFSRCLEKLTKRSRELSLDLAIPYKIGCNNSGGNWNIIKTIIEETCKDTNVFIYKKEEK